jgi:hypothetical protein
VAECMSDYDLDGWTNGVWLDNTPDALASP